MSSPIAFTDAEIEILTVLATPLPRSQRAPFLEAVGALVAQYPERGDGLVHRIAVEMQSRFMHAMPDLQRVARSRR